MLSRRQFLRGVGGGVTLITLGPLLGCSETRREPSSILAHDETWANSVCQLCPSACGLRVRLVNDRPVSVAGNPFHPTNRGGLCARGAASLQLYYDPDRLAGPLQRDASVLGGWAKLSWDDAIDGVASRLQAVSVSPGRAAVIRGDGQDITSQLLGRLVRAAGSSWVVDMKLPAEQAMEEVLQQMHGTSGRLVYDLANAEVLLSLDSALLEPSPSTMNLHRSFADMRSAGGYFVHAGPRMGVTGGKADEWLPIRPSTAGVFALGIAHMLIKEGYARTEFLRDHVTGFEDWTDEAGVQHGGVRSWILSEFSPQRVADLTGADWDQIIRVARRFGSARRPLAIGPVCGETSFQAFDAIAVHTLNAIAGAIDVPGGVLLARRAPFDDLDQVPATQAAGTTRGRRSPTIEELTDWVLQSKSPPIDLCFVHDADPVFTSPEGDRVAEALRKIPFVVSTSPVMNDTSALAKVVLPSRLWIERRCDSVTVDGNGYPVVSASPAAARPRAESRNMADVALTLAKSAGGRVAQQFPWQSYDDVTKERTEVLLHSGVGDTFSARHRSTWTQLLERSGWRAVRYHTTEQLQAQMEAHGGWWDPAYYHGEWRRIAPPANHRMNLQAAQFLSRPAVAGQGENPEAGRLLLYVYPELTLTTRISGSLPYLQDLGSPLWQSSWGTNAEINSRTAERLGLASGDRVKIKNDRGEIHARVRVSPGVRPDVVAVHSGGGREAGGRYAAGLGANPLRLVKTEPGGDSRRVRREATVVSVERVG
jgi:anaerobic selenocysteine-containing dehydrogenase